ncbi:hypothetical protein Krac_9503 [Ktedonobacter racemifer DSM 44963]|uniref:Uncharacterized protein n=1 Tax=Ktedonobacter racemifer DSM 44963 TaxID=485913 RepID=D6TC73_KTERA|nr:hypothetical protein Krac_9503 [Ktedonobacter racemifer DSM 44963]
MALFLPGMYLLQSFGVRTHSVFRLSRNYALTMNADTLSIRNP